MSNRNVKKGDMVMIIAGKDKGKTGEVTFVDSKAGKVIVDGLNVLSKSVKPRSAQEKGGIIKKSAPFDISNTLPVCPACSKVTRVGHKIEEKDGKQVKIRVCKKCGASLEKALAVKKKTAAKKASTTETKKKAVKKTTAKKPENK